MNVDESRQKAIQFLRQEWGGPKQSDEFTAEELADELGISPRAARERMMKLVRSGVWESRLLYSPEDQHQVRVWRMK